MSDAAADCLPSKGLIAENAALLSGFAGQGLALDRLVEMEFGVEFPDEDLASAASETAQALLDEVRAHQALPEAEWLIVEFEDDADEESAIELRVIVRLLPDATVISTIETILSYTSALHGGGEVAWEFSEETCVEALQ